MKAHDIAALLDEPACVHNLKSKAGCARTKPGATAGGCAFDGAQIVLELADAQPNRPTFKQMADRPGLSFESFGIGGARIEGHAIAPNGVMTPLSYSYYEPDIRYARLAGTWSDAEWAIERFAYDLGRGRVVARR